jgi:hypothetical protein
VAGVAVYGRNSKPPKGWKPRFEGDEPPSSWRVQIERTRAVAEQAGDAVVLEAHDIGKGGDPNRPEWERVLNAVKAGKIRRVYCTKMDRPMRSAKHYLDVADVFVNRGAELVFIDQAQANVIREDAFSKMVRGVGAVFAEFELDLIRERTADVMTVGEDGRTYGPRSEVPAGRPVEYGAEHKFRTRPDGSREHVKDRCPVCKGVGKPGVENAEGARPENGGVGIPVGFPTPSATNPDAGDMPDEMTVDARGEKPRLVGVLPSRSEVGP